MENQLKKEATNHGAINGLAGPTKVSKDRQRPSMAAITSLGDNFYGGTSCSMTVHNKFDM